MIYIPTDNQTGNLIGNQTDNLIGNQTDNLIGNQTDNPIGNLIWGQVHLGRGTLARRLPVGIL